MSNTALLPNAEKATHTAEQRQPPDDVVNEYEDAEENFQPKTFKFLVIIIGMYLSLFLVVLDRTIITTAVPKITDEFNSIGDIGWYGSAYMLTAACSFPISGRVYQLYSTKWAFMISLIIFEVGSALCGAAPNSATLIVGRAIAGLASAGVFSGSTMILIPLVPLRKRPVFTGLIGLSSGLASVIGPIIGGSLTDKVSWRWCFYLNLPIGGFTLLAIFFLLDINSPKKEQLSLPSQLKRLDPIGVFFFVPSIVCLILALQWGGSSYPWSSPRIIGLLITFAILFIIFIIVEIILPTTAMAPPRIIANRSIAGSMFFMFFLSGGLMSVITYLTIWFQAVKNDTAIHSGINTIPLLLSFIIFGIITAVITQKIGYYVPAMLLAPILCATGSGLLSTLTPSSGKSCWIGWQVLYGLGVGCGFQMSTLAAQAVLPRVDVPIGIALMFFMQQLGGSIFLSISQNVFSNTLVDRLSGIAELDAHIIINTGATDLRSKVSGEELQTVVEAYSHALTRVFVVTAGISACMILGALCLEWKSIKGMKKGGHDDEPTGGNLTDGGSEDVEKTEAGMDAKQSKA